MFKSAEFKREEVSVEQRQETLRRVRFFIRINKKYNKPKNVNVLSNMNFV